MSRFEEIFFSVLYVIVALFAHSKLTYEFSVPKYAILSLGFSVLLTYAIFRLLKDRKGFELNLGHLFLLGFALASLLSTINVYRDRPFYFRYSIDIALYTLLNAFIAIYLSNKYKEKGRITRFLMVMIATGGFVAFDALLNFYAGKDIFLGNIGQPFTRASIKGFIGNTIFVANYLGMLIPTTLYFILSYDMGRKAGSYLKTALAKILASVSLVLMIITVIVSQTRSEYGGVFLTNLFFFVFYFYYLKKKGAKDRAREELEKKNPELAKKLRSLQKTLIVLSAVLVAFVVILYNLPTPLTGHGEFTIARRVEAMVSRGSWDERILAWLSSVYQWKDHKILGTGIGTYQILTISYMGRIIEDHPRFVYAWNNFKRTHNDYFQVLGETGILGAFFIFSLLIYLVVYFFRTLNRLEDRDDALLLIALAMGFADFAIQSFFSFPGHLLPNTLGAIFLASAALSRQFNKDGWMSLEIKFSRTTVIVLFAALAITYASTYMRWNYFISEVNFKAGNRAYMTYVRLRDDEIKYRSKLNELKRLLNDLEKLQGNFSYLKPENFIKLKKKELESKGIKVSDVEIEKMRLEEIEKIRKKIDRDISNLERFLREVPKLRRKYYESALKYLETCLNMNHAYGKAYFYMAALSVQPERLEDLRKSIKDLDSLETFLKQDLDTVQKFIHPSKKRTDLVVLKEVLEDVKDPWKIVERIGISNIATFQAFLDSISLYETSLLVFNERNTYKAMASRFSKLHQAGKILMARLNMIEKDFPELKPKFDMVEKAMRDKTIDYYEDFVQYAKTTIYNLPASWNRFPDWKHYNLRLAVRGNDIYRFFATRAVEIQPIYVKPNYEFLKWLADKEVWACENMEKVGVWGVPDMLMDFMHALGLIFSNSRTNLKGEGLRVYEETIKLYSDSFYRIASRLDFWKERAKREFDGKLEDLISKLGGILSGMERTRLEYVKSKTKEIFSKAFDEFENSKWIAITVEEMRKFVNEKNYAYKTDPWREVLTKASKDLANLVYKMTGDGNRANEIYSIAVKSTSPGRFMYIYERYLRFKAHYRLILNDASKTLEDLKKLDGEKLLEAFSSDPLFGKPFKDVDSIKGYIENLEDLIKREIEAF